MTSFDQFRWRVFAVVLGSTLAFFIAFWVLVPPTYLTNDDVGVRRDLEGLIAPGARPTGYVLVAHSLLGWMLAWLQQIVPVHVWDVTVGGLLIWSIAVAVTAAWSMTATNGRRVLSVAVLLAVIAPLLAGMQFTISATLAGSVALATIAAELLQPQPHRPVLAASAVLFFVGLLVRPMGGAVGGLLALALLLPVVIVDREGRSIRLRRLAMTAGTVVVVAGALLYLDAALYHLSPAWNGYHEDTWMTARLFEWGGDLPPSVIEPLRTQMGWTANDWELLGRWWGVDPTTHSHARIEMLYRTWSALVDWRLQLQWLTRRMAADLNLATFARFFSQSAVTLAAIVLLAIAVVNRRGIAALAASTAIFYVACIAIEITFKELPFRLFAPLQVGFAIAALITCHTFSRPAHTAVTTLCVAIALTLAARGAHAAIVDAMADSRQSREIDAQVSDLLTLHPSLLILHSDSFPSEHWWRPFHSPPVQLPAIQLGLNNHNPYVLQFLTRYDPSLLRAICLDPSILVVSERGRLDPVTIFMREHYGMEVDWNEVYQGSFRVWRCSARNTK